MRFRSLSLTLLALICASCPSGRAGTAPDLPNIDCGSATSKTAYDDFFSGPDREARLALAGKVSSVLEELAAGRGRYQSTGAPVDLFPTVYYHTTRLGFDLALRDGGEEGPVLLDMILRFYDAYNYNRNRHDSGNSVEPHWMAYFETAVSSPADPGTARTIDILNEGVDAHVLYDIPRFVRRMRDEGVVREALLRSAFVKFDRVFDEASEGLRKDIASRNRADAEDFASVFESAASMVRFKRAKGFELGMSDRPLATVEPQPVLDHDPGSRAFFPEALKERGICR